MTIFKLSMAVIAITALAGLSNVANAEKRTGYINVKLINNTSKTLYRLSYGTRTKSRSQYNWSTLPPKKLLPGQRFTTTIRHCISDSGTPHMDMYFTYGIKTPRKPGRYGNCYVKLGREYDGSGWDTAATKSRCSSVGFLRVYVKRKKDGQNNTVTFYHKERK